MGTLRKDVISLHMDAAFRSLPSLFLFLILNRQQNFGIDHLVKMSHDPIKLGRNVTAQSRGNFQMVTADRQIHK